MGKAFSIEDKINIIRNLPAMEGRLITYQGSPKKYVHRFSHSCDVCTEDIYSRVGLCDNIFTLAYTQYLAGGVACRCGSYTLTESMLKLKVELFTKDLGYIVESFSKFNRYKTKVSLRCEGHNVILPTKYSINTILHNSSKIFFCKMCKDSSDLLSYQKEVDTALRGTTLVARVVSSSRCEVSCSVCKEDTYSVRGFCDNIFETSIYNIKRSLTVSCRCSSRPRYNLNMREHQITSLMKEEGQSLNFLKWVTKDLGVNKTKFHYYCNRHGVQEGDINNFVNNGRRCPECKAEDGSWRKYKHRLEDRDNLYTVVMTLGDEAFVKIGRTFNPTKRHADYTSTEYSISFEVLHTASHEEIFYLENKLHTLFKKHHYTPKHPFGGSVKECFTIPKASVGDVLDSLITCQ